MMAFCSVATGQPSRPNIIFIMADDLGPEWIGCYGAEGIQTPNLDRMAAEGMRFTHAYSMPKCTPTRVALLTGTYPYRNGWVNHWDVPRWGARCHFDPGHYTTFAELLRAAGYRTAIAGKWQINDFRVQPNVLDKHGFDDWCVWTGYETGNPPSAERYWDPYIHTRDGSKTYPGRFGPDVYTDFLIEFLQREDDRPACLYFPMALPHTPFVTTPHDQGATGRLAKHMAMTRYIDHLVGRLLDSVASLESGRKTLVIFTTDNGSTGGLMNRMHGRQVTGGKGKISENGCRAPFIAWGPGLVPVGRVNDTLTDFTDVLPTFAELAGADLPDGLVLDGRSIAPVLVGQAERGPRQWIMAMGGGVARLTQDNRVVPARPFADRVIRDRRYKLWVVDRQPARLYDLQQDPAETRNLIDSTDPQVLEAKQRLAAVAESFPDQDAAPRYDPTPAQAWDRKPR
ncbi:MAG: sulfatase-like hydrolase/transferase [Planctomycetota bacterium]